MNLLDRMAYLREHPEDGPTPEQISQARTIIREHGCLVEVQSEEDGWLAELDDTEHELSHKLDEGKLKSR